MGQRKGTSKSARAARAGLPRWVWIAVIGVIAVGAIALPNLLRAQPTEALPAEVDTAQAAALREQGAVVLDVREPEEWAEYHIPGATLIPLGQLAARVNEIPRDRPVLVYCRSGNRSQEGRDILLRAGFTQVTSLRGGIKAWAAAGLPTVSGP